MVVGPSWRPAGEAPGKASRGGLPPLVGACVGRALGAAAAHRMPLPALLAALAGAAAARGSWARLRPGTTGLGLAPGLGLPALPALLGPGRALLGLGRALPLLPGLCSWEGAGEALAGAGEAMEPARVVWGGGRVGGGGRGAQQLLRATGARSTAPAGAIAIAAAAADLPPREGEAARRARRQGGRRASPPLSEAPEVRSGSAFLAGVVLRLAAAGSSDMNPGPGRAAGPAGLPAGLSRVRELRRA
jgi:hypothetical protein